LRIAQIAPLAESVPPKLYGGTERVISYLTEELVRQGHEVTLFASGDSATSAELVSGVQSGLRLQGVANAVPYELAMLRNVRRQAARFDVLHFHLDAVHLEPAPRFTQPVLTTIHGRIDLPHLAERYRARDDMPLVSISDSQRAPLPDAPWLGTVHHGLPRSVCQFEPSPRGGYLAFLGRISRDKRVDRAIEIARCARLPLHIAAKIDPSDLEYYEQVVRPAMRDADVKFIGEISESQKAGFLGNAIALLWPIDWPEPFGLAMIEAMSCGTPVVAWDEGSTREVVDHALTGYVVSSIGEAVKAVSRVQRLDRRRIRRRFEQRFTAKRMARDYLQLYERLASPLFSREVPLSLPALPAPAA
jgi:glycosyltransferase involved in cell wall biosynthesis